MKKLSLPLLAVLLFIACQKQIDKQIVSEEIGSVAAKDSKTKIDVCHNGQTISINLNAWPDHQSHGDLRLDDQDGDGFVPNNDCGFGQMGDCDDNNASVNPGATEICDNAVDENCNGLIDENCIPSVTICSQIWMTKNLDVDHYRNGDPIPQVTDPTEWSTLTTGAWCYYNNDPATGAIYGKLYNWYAVNDPRGLAPSGWHVASYSEWGTLSGCLGNDLIAGGKMKSTGTIEEGTGLWYSPNIATNSSGFSALPGGARFFYGSFGNIGYSAFWWSSTTEFPGVAPVLYVYNGSENLFFGTSQNYVFGNSVRCVKN